MFLERLDLGFKENDVIIDASNLETINGYVYLLIAFAGVVEICPEAKLVLMNKDEFNGKPQELAKFLCLKNNVLFLDKSEDVSHLLDFIDLGVYFGLSKDMPPVILEYMIASKPVITSRCEDKRKLIEDGFNGILVDMENVQELKNAMLGLILDPFKRRTLGENSRKKATITHSLSPSNSVR